MSLGAGFGAWLDAMHHDPDKSGVSLKENNMSLPEDLDYKIVHGFADSNTVDVVVFSKKRFEETGCEFEAEVFRVTISNIQGTTEVVVTEDDVSVVELDNKGANHAELVR